METIKVNRNLSDIDDVHELLNKTMIVTSKLKIGEKINLNLFYLRYITPIGFTGLLSILDYLEEKYEVEIEVPFLGNPVKYMERMNFFKTCSDNIRIQFEEQMDMESISVYFNLLKKSLYIIYPLLQNRFRISRKASLVVDRILHPIVF